MVPTLKIDRDDLKNNNFVNAYIEDLSRDVQYKDSVYLLFKPNKIDNFRHFLLNEYERTENVIDDYDTGDGVVIVYKLNQKYKKDFELIESGKYSKVSEEFQKLFPKVVKIVKSGLFKDELSLQYRIFNKTEDLIKYWEDKLDIEFDKNQEVWEGFHYNNEILDINIKKLIDK